MPFLTAQAEGRLAQSFGAALQLVGDSQPDAQIAWYEARNLLEETLRRETTMLDSLVVFTGAPADLDAEGIKALDAQFRIFEDWLDSRAKDKAAKGAKPAAPWSGADAQRVPVRMGEFGPLTYQNDDVLRTRLGRERYGKIRLLNSEATQMLNVKDQSELYAYEIVNFANGKRTLGEIRDAVSAEYGPLPMELVADYLQACVEAGVMQWK